MPYADRTTVDGVVYNLRDNAAVRFDGAQTLTDAQKSQARENIGIDATLLTGAVRYDAVQTLTDAQKLQARQNIGSGVAVSVADNRLTIVADLGVAVSGNTLTIV